MTKKSYAEVLESINLPKDIPETIKCKMCGEPMQLLRVNPQIGFWLHHGKSLIVCGQKNCLHPGKPMIAQNMKFYKGVIEAWKEHMEDKKIVSTKN